MSGDRGPTPALPLGAIGTSASGWWGVTFLMLSEATLFGYVFFSYFYYSVQSVAGWVPGGPPSFAYSAPQTAIVLVGCFTAWLAHSALDRDAVALSLAGSGATVVLGGGFIALQLLDWLSKPFSFSDSTYSSVYFLVSGLHLAHFVVGWLMFLVLFAWTALGYFDRVRCVPLLVGAFYWYFLAATWLAVFFVLNATPYFFSPG